MEFCYVGTRSLLLFLNDSAMILNDFHICGPSTFLRFIVR